MSEVNTLISDCQEEADPDQCSTVDIGQAVFSPGLAEVGNQWPEQESTESNIPTARWKGCHQE